MDMRPVYIYGLADPDTNEIRYIGKSVRPFDRLANHMNDKSKCHRAHWLQSLKAQNKRPNLVLLEMIQGEWPWQESERYWIARGRALGWRLTNNTSGGDGVSDLPKEARERMRQAWLGRKHKPETLEKLSKASKGRRKTQEAKDYMSELMKGRRITWGDKISENAKKLTAEECETIRERLKNGEGVMALAVEYGVHRTTLSKVKSGKYEIKYQK